MQSGKTANYIGLANKAFDVGYKIVIIFTGMTEDLRKQTQDRVNSGIIGKNEHSEKYGIGKLASHKPDSIKGATNIFLDLNIEKRSDINNQFKSGSKYSFCC